MAQNLIEKIVQKFAINMPENHIVQSGDFLSVKPSHVLTHDNTGAVIKKFKTIGVSKMANPRQPVFALDHRIQDKSEANLKKYANIEKFAKEMGVDFYPAGRGIGHQIMCEEGYVFPGTMAVASDSHSNMYGGLGCLGTPIVRTDAAGIWATGQIWWQVPPVVKVELYGKLPKGVVGKDIAIALCGLFNKDEVLNHAIEFIGDGIAQLSIDQRLTIANMSTEWGALVGLFPIDNITIEWLENRYNYIKNRGLVGVPSDAYTVETHPRINLKRIENLKHEKLQADPDAYYSKIIHLDLATVTPYIAGPHHLKITEKALDFSKKEMKIHKAYLVSCVNSRVEDLAQAAEIMKDKKVHPEVKFYVAAASDEVQKESEKHGDWQILINAGAIALPPGCGPCIGLGDGLLEENEVGISATNRNFKGRMGVRNSETYLASPAVVAASAIAGIITVPDNFSDIELKGNIEVIPAAKKAGKKIDLIDNFPKTIEGEILFCHQDNLNTDGIFPGKYTYLDDFTAEQQAQVVMENYDPEFVNIAQNGDILVGSFNFGTGSSREQAATAFKHKGIQLVIAGSFSETYKRNAFNNGFPVLESPELAKDLKEKFGDTGLTVRTGINIKIDFENSLATANNKEYAVSSVGAAAQELVLCGGLEEWIKKAAKGS